ncbi:MAG: HEPN domain-containing protein [Candidatus Binatia bacterium]
MKETTQKLLEKASRSVRAAELLAKDGDAEFAIGRAYYAMFYAAQALLNEKTLRFQRHSGVHNAFAEQYIKTGLIDKRYHRWFIAAFNKRITGDYGIEADLTAEDAGLLIGQAVEFVRAAAQFLKRKV